MTDPKPQLDGSPGDLQSIVETDVLFNGVATGPSETLYINYVDRSHGFSVARLTDGKPQPFPNHAWNSWRPGADAHNAFVAPNALRTGPDGALWVVDAGAPSAGEDQVPGGAKLVAFDLGDGSVVRAFPLADAVRSKSFLDDFRFNGDFVYLTDAGSPGALLVLDLRSGLVTRRLENHRSTQAQGAQTAEGQPLKDPEGRPIAFNADQLEVSPDGAWLFFQPATGPLYRVATSRLHDPQLDDQRLGEAVQLWARTRSTGGTAMDAAGNIYASALDDNAILRITPEGAMTTLIQDARLTWVDAMWIDDRGRLLMPAVQLHRAAPMNGGHNEVQLPVKLYALDLGAEPLRR